jgi:hypothetical protein
MTAAASATIVTTIPARRRRVRRSAGDLRTVSGEVPHRFWMAIPDNGRDARAQGTGRHPVTHCADAEDCNRLTTRCHGSPLAGCQIPPLELPGKRLKYLDGVRNRRHAVSVELSWSEAQLGSLPLPRH